jgi:hypothetical protein
MKGTTMVAREDRTKRLSKQVHGRERFRLAVEMAARGHLSEAEDLILGASRVDCSHLDPQMGEAFEDLRSLMREFDASTRKLFGILLTLDLLRDLFSDVGAKADLRDVPVFSAPLIVETLERLTAPVEAKLKALEGAFEELCQERLGVEPEAVRAVLPGWVQGAFRDSGDRLADALVDPEEHEISKQELLVGWGPDGLGSVLKPGEMS